MARKLTHKELQQTKADFDAPKVDSGQTPLLEADSEKKKTRQKKINTIKDMGRAASALVNIEMGRKFKCPGRPRKYESSKNVTFRLPTETIRKLRVKAALEERSPADIIVELVAALGVPGCA